MRGVPRQQGHSFALLAAGPIRQDPDPAAAASTPGDTTLLKVLLGACDTVEGLQNAPLQALWEQEALHRAANFLQLAIMSGADLWGTYDPKSSRAFCAKAKALADIYRCLYDSGTKRSLCCRAVLRAVCEGLVDVFATSSIKLVLAFYDRPVRLPAIKRRALALIASELVINALRHAFAGRDNGTIVIRLYGNRRQQLEFSVCDDGVGIAHARLGEGHEILQGLASVLEAKVSYSDLSQGGTGVFLRFPHLWQPNL